jgi:hypothetical protein
MTNLFILEFEHRDDGGPRHVGTFPSRGEVLTHLEWLGLPDAVWTIQRLTPAAEDYPHPQRPGSGSGSGSGAGS